MEMVETSVASILLHLFVPFTVTFFWLYECVTQMGLHKEEIIFSVNQEKLSERTLEYVRTKTIDILIF